MNNYEWVEQEAPEFEYYWTKEKGWTMKAIKEPVYLLLKTGESK
jgi:hypothetical protein